jgi:TRAP-type uncharacterized transport system substrate-binding protein
MKKFTVIAGLLVSAAIAAQPVITTGSKKGLYYKEGIRIAGKIGATVETSKGSVQNLDRLMSNQAQIAIAQKDAYRWYTKKHPDASNKIDLIGDLGEECVFIVAKTDGKVDDDGDLQKDGVKIAVGKTGSGSQVSWDYMTMLEPKFKKATAIPKGGSRALAKVISGQYDAIMFVQAPKPDSWLMTTVNSNKDLKFIPVTDWDLNDKYNGKPVYTFKKVTTKKGFFGDSVKTICTTASVFVNDQIDEDKADDLADVLLKYRNYIIKGE